MTSSIQRMPTQTQLSLIHVAHSIEVRGPDATESFFESTVLRVFAKKAQKKALLALVKEDTDFSSKVKLDIMEVFEPKGRLARARLAGEQKCSQNVVTTL